MFESRPTIEVPLSELQAHITPSAAGNSQAAAKPEWIAELLGAFSGNDPAGEDASGSTEYFNLDLSFESPTPSYESCIAWAMKIISEISKDLKVASLLTLCLYRQRGLAGYYEGLSLIAAILKKFGASAFPKSPSSKTAAINKLLTTRFLIFLAKEHPSLADKPLLENMLQRLREIEENFAEIFAGSPPRLKRIAEIFGPTLKTLQEEERKQKEEAAQPKENLIVELGTPRALEVFVPTAPLAPEEKNDKEALMASGPEEKKREKKITRENGAAEFAEMQTEAQPPSQSVPEMDAVAAVKISLMPAAMGEEYDEIKKEYEAACRRVPAEFDAVAKAMQAGIQAETRRKGRFLRTLHLANLCLHSHEERLARVFLEKLEQDISEHRLDEWEPELCVEVWSSHYLALECMLKSETDAAQCAQLRQRLEELYAKIALQDCAVARHLVAL